MWLGPGQLFTELFHTKQLLGKYSLRVSFIHLNKPSLLSLSKNRLVYCFSA